MRNFLNMPAMIKKNDLKRIVAVAIIAVVALLFFWVGIAFFTKNNNTLKLSDKQQNNQQTENLNEKRELKEKEEVRRIAENFVTTYYSYTWGDFSNVESQYCYMMDEMKRREEIKVAKMKKEIEGQTQKYFTVRAELLDSEMVLFTGITADLNMKLNISNLSGAIVQRDTMIWVDKNGDYYEGDSDDLIVDTVEKNIQINLIKISNEWKVDWIKVNRK